MPNKQFHINERVVGCINTNKHQIGLVQEIIRGGNKTRYRILWENGRSTTETTRAINASLVEAPEIQGNQVVGGALDHQENFNNENDDIIDDNASEASLRNRLSLVRMNLAHRHLNFDSNLTLSNFAIF